ncbi:stabilizer of axonemal microtubules 5 isoform 1-T1 [Chlamydotis macqueenii]
MAASVVAAIPAPLTGLPFLKASHFRLGNEGWAPASSRQSFSHSQFPPFRGFHRPPPAPQPRSGQLLSSAGGGGGETCSETRWAFPAKSPQPVAPFLPMDSCVRMHADPRIHTLGSVMRESFCPHTPVRRPTPPTINKWKDDVPCGDREKIRPPPSLYTCSYPAHEAQPAARLHRGCVSNIKEDGQSYYDTSYQAEFKGERAPPAKPKEKHLPPIQFGDPRSSASVSEQKHAYSAPGKRTHRAYDKEHTAAQIRRTNMQLGDGCTRFCTSTSEFFPVRRPEPVTTVHPNRNLSSIPRGDEDPERNRALARTTTTQLLSYPEADRWNLAPKPRVEVQRNQSNFCLGNKCSGSQFFSTTQQADYRPPHQSQRVTADSKSHCESHMPFDYHDESYVTTTQAMLVPHGQQKGRLPEDRLQELKSSHLDLPWKAQDVFRTEQKDAFTPKSRGPAAIPKASSKVSCVPIGTLKKYHPQRKVLFAA